MAFQCRSVTSARLVEETEAVGGCAREIHLRRHHDLRRLEGGRCHGGTVDGFEPEEDPKIDG